MDEIRSPRLSDKGAMHCACEGKKPAENREQFAPANSSAAVPTGFAVTQAAVAAAAAPPTSASSRSADPTIARL
jgi:hypothetical protein